MSRATTTLMHFGGFRQSLAASFMVALTIDAAVAAVGGTDTSSPNTEAPLAKAIYEREDSIERITFDLVEPLGHVAKRDGDQLIIWFDQPRQFDLGALDDRGSSQISLARQAEAGATRWLVLDLAPGSHVDNGVLEGSRLTITIRGKQANGALAGSKDSLEAKVGSAARKPEASQAESVRPASGGQGSDTSEADPASKQTAIADGEKAQQAPKRKSEPQAGAMPTPLMPVARPAADNPLKTEAAGSTPAAPQDQAKAPAQPASLPGQFEVDETALDRALERTLTREGAVLMPFGMIELEPSVSYVRQELDTPGLINILGFPGFGEAEIRRNDYVAGLVLRVGLPLDAQLEVDGSYSYIDQTETMSIGFNPVSVNDDDAGAFGDLGVGLAKTVLKEGGWWPDVVARVHWDSHTGKSVDNGIALGGGNHELTGSVSLVKSQDPLAFFGTVSYEKTFEENDLDPGDRIGVSIGTVLAASPDTSLRASLRQDFIDDAEFEGDQLDGTDQMAATLNIGAASVLGRGILLDASAEIGLTEDAPDYAARLSLPIRFNLRRAFSLGTPAANDDG